METIINLRRPTEAVIQPGQIKEEHLADGAIDLGNAKVSGLLPNGKLDVIEDVNKIKDDLITLAKVNNDVKVNPYVGGEVEQSVAGMVETGIVETGFIKIPGRFSPKLLRVIGSLKSNDALKTATMNIYVDDEVDPRIILTSVAIDYELLDAEIDISDLANGRHKITVKLVSDAVDGIAYNDFIDFYFVK